MGFALSIRFEPFGETYEMKRRQFVSAAVALPALAASSSSAWAYDGTEYSRELYESALASGESFILDFSARW